MGQITFWGPQHGLGVTSNTAAIAAVCALEYQIRTLTSQPQWGDSSLEYAFAKSIQKYNREFMSITGSGLDSLERVVRSNKLERDSVKNNALLIEPDRLDYLQGSMKLTKQQFEEASEIFRLIYRKAKEYYDVVLLDLHSGSNSPVIQTLASESDLIVVCLNQNIAVLDKYFKDKSAWPAFLHGKEHVVLLGQYDPNSKYKVKNIANKYNYKGKILTIPYNTEFKDYYNDGDVKGFFSKNRFVTKRDENYLFIDEVRNASKYILNEMGVNTQLKHVERGAS